MNEWKDHAYDPGSKTKPTPFQGSKLSLLFTPLGNLELAPSDDRFRLTDEVCGFKNRLGHTTYFGRMPESCLACNLSQ